jgi:hypothetical protein
MCSTKISAECSHGLISQVLKDVIFKFVILSLLHYAYVVSDPTVSTAAWIRACLRPAAWTRRT